jgi:tripartite-type tricarboxylate transporter receptor subunit TctC
MNRRLSLLKVAAILSSKTLALLPSASRAAGPYPDRPIKLVVPYAAGGGVDNIARIVAIHLGARLKKSIIVENRPGASANIGATFVAKSAADGYTLLMGSTFLAFNRAAMKAIPYDASRDFIPLGRTGTSPFLLVVSASSPFKTLGDLIAYMKAHPEKAFFGTVAAGAPVNLIFPTNTGTDPTQVLYKSTAAAAHELMGGEITYIIQTSSELLPNIRSGKLRALAVTGTKRFHHLPEVPTMKEAGVSDLELTGWYGIFAPANTPASVVQHLSDGIQAAMQQPELVAAMEGRGIAPSPMATQVFSPFYQEELKSYADIARKFDLKIE